MIKSLIIARLALGIIAVTAFGGTTSYSGKDMKEAGAQAPPCAEWYGDTEWNVNLWGTYAWTGNDGHAEIGNSFNLNRGFAEVDLSRLSSNDQYLQTDHAWGGGVDLKYFFHRYFGVGIEGFLVDAKRNTLDASFSPLGIIVTRGEDRRVIGSTLGTFTLRYPIRCSRLSPYVWAAVGGIFNGGERDVLIVHNRNLPLSVQTEHRGSESEVMGQFGGGLEFRFTRHLGWTNDVSWNVIEGPDNNFGMVRSGLTFSF